jgi:hypothetical protein
MAGLLVTAAAIAVGAGAVNAKTHTGKSDSGTAYASINHTANGVEDVSATVSDKLLGRDAITAPVTLAASGGAFKLSSSHAVLYTGTGSLVGTLSATVTVSGTTETLSNGKLNLTTGKGSQTGHSLVGTFTGTGSASSNQFTLHYRGTYK